MAQKNFADAMNQIVNSTPNGLKAQINEKVGKNSPAFTGTPTAPTPDNDTDSTQLATTEFCQNLIRRLVGSAPETLDALVELAAAINNDPTFAQTIIQALDGKLNKTDAANTYATKAELSNVSVDTSNLAKLNAENTFTQVQIFEHMILLKNFGLKEFMDGDCYGTNDTRICGLYMDFGGARGQVTLHTNDGVQIYSSGKTYTFKSDGIYLGNTKITN